MRKKRRSSSWQRRHVRTVLIISSVALSHVVSRLRSRHGSGLGWAGIRPMAARPTGLGRVFTEAKPAHGYCRVWPNPPNYPPRCQDLPDLAHLGWVDSNPTHNFFYKILIYHTVYHKYINHNTIIMYTIAIQDYILQRT